MGNRARATGEPEPEDFGQRPLRQHAQRRRAASGELLGAVAAEAMSGPLSVVHCPSLRIRHRTMDSAQEAMDHPICLVKLRYFDYHGRAMPAKPVTAVLPPHLVELQAMLEL